MSRLFSSSLLLFLILFLACGSSSKLVLGDCPLTITVESDDDAFSGAANVYINGKFIGTTDANSRQFKVSLKKGAYDIIVVAEGYLPWRKPIQLLGNNYKQNALVKLKKRPPKPDTQEPAP